MKNNLISGDNFHWLKLNIDDLYLTNTIRRADNSTKWLFIELIIKYLKSEGFMTLKDAENWIGKEELQELLKYGDVVKPKDNDIIKIEFAMKMWKVYARTKEGQSKGGKKTQSINKEQKSELSQEEIDVIKEQNKLDDELPF